MATATVNALPAVGVIVNGSPTVFQIIVTNTGPAPATVLSFTMSAPTGSALFTFVPQPLPIGGAVVAAGSTQTFLASNVFYANQSASLGYPISTFGIQFAVNFSDGTSINSPTVQINPLPLMAGAASFYAPTNSAVLLALGM